MAIYSLNISTVSRSSGASTVAGSAYRACERIEEDRTGDIHDYTHKKGLMYETILTPRNVEVPQWAYDRGELWNTVETSNKRVNATLAREITFALPHELNDSERESLATEYGQWIADRHQVICDVCLHTPDKGGDDRNYHAHILITASQITEDGFNKKKSQTIDGETIRFIAFDYGGKRGAEETKIFREKAAEITNEALETASHNQRVDHRSYADQGLDKLPTIHLGKDATELQRKGEEIVRLQVANEKTDLTNQVHYFLNEDNTLPSNTINDNETNDNLEPIEHQTLDELRQASEKISEQIAEEQEQQNGILYRALQGVVSAAHWLQDNATELYHRFYEDYAETDRLIIEAQQRGYFKESLIQQEHQTPKLEIDNQPQQTP